MKLSNKEKEVIEIALHELSCVDCPYDEECIDEENYLCMRVKDKILKL